MAETVYAPGLAIGESDSSPPRHSATVRLTHWITTLSFVGLVVSGIAILLAHPRLYWGETGAVGTPALIELPLPLVLTGQSGWGRYLHFLAAWLSVLTGLLYFVSGVLTGHFRKHLVPARADLSRHSLRQVVASHLRLRLRDAAASSYNVLQQLTYCLVIFVLFPLMIWTGFAMSPAITSVFPWFVALVGGQQSARTIHFFAAALLVLFLLVHIGMVCAAGFGIRMRSMVTGRRPSRLELP